LAILLWTSSGLAVDFQWTRPLTHPSVWPDKRAKPARSPAIHRLGPVPKVPAALLCVLLAPSLPLYHRCSKGPILSTISLIPTNFTQPSPRHRCSYPSIPHFNQIIGVESCFVRPLLTPSKKKSYPAKNVTRVPRDLSKPSKPAKPTLKTAD
jgi:hypothetical protein